MIATSRIGLFIEISQRHSCCLVPESSYRQVGQRIHLCVKEKRIPFKYALSGYLLVSVACAVCKPIGVNAKPLSSLNRHLHDSTTLPPAPKNPASATGSIDSR